MNRLNNFFFHVEISSKLNGYSKYNFGHNMKVSFRKYIPISRKTKQVQPFPSHENLLIYVGTIEAKYTSSSVKRRITKLALKVCFSFGEKKFIS